LERPQQPAVPQAHRFLAPPATLQEEGAFLVVETTRLAAPASHSVGLEIHRRVRSQRKRRAFLETYQTVARAAQAAYLVNKVVEMRSLASN
jgi:hypothetical protein